MLSNAKLNADLTCIKKYGSKKRSNLDDLRNAVDNLMEFVGRSLCGEFTELPRGWDITFWQENDCTHSWRLTRRDEYTANLFGRIGEGAPKYAFHKPRALLIRFAKDIATGWLEEVGAVLADHHATKVTAMKEVKVFIE